MIINVLPKPLDLAMLPDVVQVKSLNNNVCSVTFASTPTPKQISHIQEQGFAMLYQGKGRFEIEYHDPYEKRDQRNQAILQANIAVIEARQAAGERVLLHVFFYEAGERGSAGMDGYRGAFLSIPGIERMSNPHPLDYPDVDVAVLDRKKGILVLLIQAHVSRDGTFTWRPPHEPERLT